MDRTYRKQWGQSSTQQATRYPFLSRGVGRQLVPWSWWFCFVPRAGPREFGYAAPRQLPDDFDVHAHLQLLRCRPFFWLTSSFWWSSRVPVAFPGTTAFIGIPNSTSHTSWGGKAHAAEDGQANIFLEGRIARTAGENSMRSSPTTLARLTEKEHCP